MKAIDAHKSLRIRYKPGRKDVLVISFAGRGGQTDNFKRPVNEFYNLASGGGDNHVLFVQDMTNSWMNGAGIADAVCEVVRSVGEEAKAKRLITLGNSMGGTMALLLPQLMHVDAAIAISPQFSVDPRIVPEDTRWMEDRSNIEKFRFTGISSVPFEHTRTTVLHGGKQSELVHALRFPRHKEFRHFIFPDYGHNLASALHKDGKLAPIVLFAIAMRPRRTRQSVEAAGGMLRHRFEARQAN